ncbi:HAMP domain-containing sensor histidine kinase [Aurantimonas sp. HBX-1]|uniref:sensor histidine kinase n=1 Tax=Aurantimonas sp. HBX-1 TaxID=2906072 RepID=UPI001F3BC39B|nr:HAMP domain-containing sensor histidine kinase [Aurantimonas sp. HBX-1]UIJ71347.1 HAMP domain-containing histidine kinase [Aurantimonas sp. HBX-1]
MQQSVDSPAGDPAPVPMPARGGRRRLSRRLLLITMLAVMLAEVLIFVPSIANFREGWLEAKLETAAVAGLASQGSEAEGDATLEADQGTGLLVALDAMLVAIIEGGASRLIARAETIDVADLQVDLADRNPVTMIVGAFDTLLLGGDRTMRISGPVGDGSLVAEVVMSERPLRRDMLIYSRNILFLSLAIASFAALLVYAAISFYLVRPIQAMTGAMIRFGENPADPGRIIQPSGRGDEIGTAEAQLADMQARLAGTLREQRHLADLGLAVAKINHDLRNILASAQMVSDRLADVPDPRVQRVVPPLVRSLDRALAYTQSVLSYGRAIESPPAKRAVRLARLVDDVFEVVAPPEGVPIELVNAVPEALEIAVDPDQFHRVLVNLCRNAVQALEGDAADLPSLVRRVTVDARPEPPDEVLISIEDTGPGLPARARDNLFKAFQGSARTGGTGLGLAIVAEIVQAHGGRIALAERPLPGTRFEIRMPGRVADGEAGPSRAG